MKLLTTTIAVLTLLVGVAGHASAQETIERQFLQQAPKLIKHFQDKGYRNVGVLKFLVARKSAEAGKMPKLSDNVGTLNMLLARRLELALILANSPLQPIGIIENASAVAQRTRGASHMSRDGRLRLFEARYPLAWGNSEVEPDAFVTGVAQIAGDLRTLTISLLAFDRRSNQLAPVLQEFTAASRADQLSEMGESFVLRGAFDDGNVNLTTPENKVQQKIIQTALQVHDKTITHPASQTDAPVTLEISYHGRNIPYEIKDGKAFIPEPDEDQDVLLVLKRDAAKENYGVVLKVNGENTLDKERQPDLYCQRWVLEAGRGPAGIEGYYMSNNMLGRFRGLSAAESKAKEFNYGNDVGTITMTVFREFKGKERTPDIADDAAKEQAVARLTTPKDRPKNFHALKASLLEDANRGLIGEGQRVGAKLETVSFTPDPRPVMCLTVVYYKR